MVQENTVVVVFAVSTVIIIQRLYVISLLGTPFYDTPFDNTRRCDEREESI